MKNRMKNQCRPCLWMAVMLLLVMVACDVHEFPKTELEGKATAVRVWLQVEPHLMGDEGAVLGLEETMPDAKTEKADLRYVVRIYKADDKGEFGSAELKSVTLTRSQLDEEVPPIELELEKGTYRVLAWADWVDLGSQAHKFYNPDHFAEITFHGNYQGNTNLRDAFAGEATADVGSSPMDIKVLMRRPLAKYKFVATDFELFLSRELSKLERSGNDPSRVVDLADYSVTFHYTQFVPSAFNLFTDKPIDSRTGLSFKGQIKPLSHTEAELGFDYVMMPQGDAPMPELSLVIADKDGVELARMNAKNVKLTRNHLTLIKGEFLTAEMPGGVEINPGFDGDHNVAWP